MSDEIKVTVVDCGPKRNLVMRYVDPITGKQITRTSGTRNRTQAERAAAVWQDELNGGRYKAPSKITWAEFREKYEAERVALMALSGRRSVTSAFNHLERVINPDRLGKLTTATVGRFMAELRKPRTVVRKDGKEETLPPVKEPTIASYCRSLKAALRWAERMGLLAVVPRFDMPDAGEAKGRPLTGEEYERLLVAVPKVRPRDAAAWERFITGLWLSGLRLGEALALSWDIDALLAVDLAGRFPALQIAKQAQKSRKTERWPLPPDFAEWLLQTPEAERAGKVFKLPNLRDGRPLGQLKAGLIVSRVGEAARIVVAKDPETGEVKYASAHDLRRSFGTRWAKRIMPATLQRLMRHADIATTMRYYVQLGADDVAAELWANHKSSASVAQAPNQGQERSEAETESRSEEKV